MPAGTAIKGYSSLAALGSCVPSAWQEICTYFMTAQKKQHIRNAFKRAFQE